MLPLVLVRFFLLIQPKSGEALASLVAPTLMPLAWCTATSIALKLCRYTWN